MVELEVLMIGRIAIMAVLLVAGVACASTPAESVSTRRVSQSTSGNTLEAKIELLEQRIAGLEARRSPPSNQTYQRERRSSDLDGLERRVISLEMQVGRSQSYGSGLEGRVSSMERSISSLQSRVGSRW